MTSTVSKDGDYVSCGGITAPLPEFANNGIGFYINATPNKEADALQSLWKRNNLYVQHNKIYYRAAASGAPKRDVPQFVPVIFDEDMQAMDDERGESVASNYRNRVYARLLRRQSWAMAMPFFMASGPSALMTSAKAWVAWRMTWTFML